MVEYLVIMPKTLNLIPSTTKTNNPPKSERLSIINCFIYLMGLGNGNSCYLLSVV
jgi:hypothetical protein